MSELHFSAEAVHAYLKVIAESGEFATFSEEVRLHAQALDAALAHDAERLTREIIKQRVAALTDEQLRDDLEMSPDYPGTIGWNENVPHATWVGARAVLLRALTEQHD